MRAACILIAGFVVTASAALAGAGTTEPARVPQAVVVSKRLPATALVDWALRAGDDARWASPAFDDSAWEKVVVAGGRRLPRNYWLRRTVDVPASAVSSSPLAVSFYNLPSAFEVYWDGALLGRNGRVGASQAMERPGAVRYLLILDRTQLTPGRHLLALRVSNHHVPIPTMVTSVGLAPVLATMARGPFDQLLISLGLYLFAALFSAALFLRGGGRVSLLFFAGFAGLHVAHGAWGYAVESAGLTMGTFAWGELLVVTGLLASLLLLTAFLLWHFDVAPRRLLLVAPIGLVLPVLLWRPPPVLGVLVLHSLLVGYAFVVTLVPAVRGARGARLAATGVGVLWAYHLAILGSVFSPALAALAGPFDLVPLVLSLSCLMGVIALRVRDEARALSALQSRSERLEAELLKKTIQPHFLMNTLLSIQSWFGEDPVKAGRLVEALADEFRIISRISAQPEIDMAEEIHLCRRHLELMGYRKDAVYRLEVTGRCEGIRVPPMLFHTLVENGLTHAYHARENGTFWLTCARRERSVEFVLENDGSRLAELAAGSTSEIEEGMGLKYVRSRLQESAPGCWELDYGVRGGRWRVRILMRKARER